MHLGDSMQTMIATDIALQVCMARDNVQVDVDGILYLKVLRCEIRNINPPCDIPGAIEMQMRAERCRIRNPSSESLVVSHPRRGRSHASR
jgi:regulator of protease activity HflC (stomatin/prohibitin superfamily)